jgi:hypothetical protein
VSGYEVSRVSSAVAELGRDGGSSRTATPIELDQHRKRGSADVREEKSKRS